MVDNFEIEKECNRIIEDATYSSKGHYNSADIYQKVHYCIGVTTIFLSAIGAILVFTNCKTSGGIIAIIVSLLSALQTFVGASDKTSNHKKSACEYHTLKNYTRNFMNIKLPNMTEKEAQEAFLHLADKRDILNRTSPNILKKAFESARKGIEEGESNYKIDKQD